MKAETKRDVVFTPIELFVTIESKRELEFLLSLFNASDASISEFANKHRLCSEDFGHAEMSTFSIYRSLSKHNK